MANVNWAAAATSTKTAGGSGDQGPTGTASNIFDENENTYYMWRDEVILEQHADAMAWGQSAFANEHTITRIKAVIKAVVGSIAHAYSHTYLVQIYSEGSWKTVGSGSLVNGVKTTKDYTSLNYRTSTKVKVTVTAHGGLVSIGFGWAEAYDYELYAWESEYVDIGIRVRKSAETIKIGVENLESAHKLRIRKGATTYGIPLLDTSDDSASPIRIYDGSVIKALPKVD